MSMVFFSIIKDHSLYQVAPKNVPKIV